MREKSNVLFRFIALTSKCINQEPSLFILNILSIFLETVNNTILILLPKYLLNALSNSNLKQFVIYLLVFIGMRLIVSLVANIINPLISKRREHFNSIIINEFLEKSKRIKLEKFDEPGFYNLYLLSFNKCCDICQGILNIVMHLVQSALTIIITSLILSWINPLVFICMCIFVFFQTFIANRIKKINYDFSKQVIEHNKQLNYIYRLFYIPEYIRDIRINNIFDFVFSKKNAVAAKVIDLNHSTKRKIADHLFFSILLSFVEMILINGYLGYMVLNGTIWIDMYVTSQSSYSHLESSISSILELYTQIYENDLYVKDYLNYLSAEEEVCGNIHIQSNEIRKITFDNVCFIYPNTSVYALQNVSFSINRGEKILISGENGAGKTTVIRLLLRLYDPSSGHIKINDIDIKEYSISSIRQSFSTLLQDSETYAFSIYDNLCFGKRTAMNGIKDIMKKVELNEVIENLKNGFDTPISSQIYNNGIDFSAGEKQKLILARCFLKGNETYILDEPTSNLDVNAETNILSPIINASNVTLILISHKLKYVKSIDKIIFLKKGQIIEKGTKRQILSKENGEFAKLYNSYINKL